MDEVGKKKNLIKYVRDRSIANFAESYPYNIEIGIPPVSFRELSYSYSDDRIALGGSQLAFLIVILGDDWQEWLDKMEDIEIEAFLKFIISDDFPIFTKEQRKYLKQRGIIINNRLVRG